jgi:hypothetical protein
MFVDIGPNRAKTACSSRFAVMKLAIPDGFATGPAGLVPRARRCRAPLAGAINGKQRFLLRFFEW